MVNVAMKIGMNRHEYDQKNHLVETKKNGQTENLYIYDGDGNRVARLDANNEGTILIGNYFESNYPRNAIPEPPPPVTEWCGDEEEGCIEPQVIPTPQPGPKLESDISYYYAGSQRIAMRNVYGAFLLLTDHLGSSSVVMKANGELVEKAYYMPWGGARGEEAITSTDYGYTGQMREGDIYYYGARWYDPSIGRFMQADTIVPLNVQGTQAFDRYAYVNNNPLRYTDPTGHYYQECGDDNYGRCGIIPPPSVGSGLPSSYSIYNIMVCGWGSEASCGQGYGTPLYPYYDWPGENYFYKALNISGGKYNAMKEILALLDGLTGGAQLYLSGHSAGADSVLLLLDVILGNVNYPNIEILGVVLLDPSLTAGGGPIGGPDYTTLGSLTPILRSALEKGIPTYVGVTDSYEAASKVRDYIGYSIFPTAQYPNYSYNSPALVDMTTYMSHDDLGISVYYALEAWMFFGGIR